MLLKSDVLIVLVILMATFLVSCGDATNETSQTPVPSGKTASATTHDSNPEPSGLDPDPALQVSEYIRRIFQDKDGNLWFGTNYDGVGRYDGDSLTYFSTKEGLSGIAVMGIIEDKDGNLWFGTNGGISKYDGRSFTNFTEDDGLSDNYVRSLFGDRTGTIWVGTSEGVCRYDGKTFTPFPMPKRFLQPESQARDAVLKRP